MNDCKRITHQEAYDASIAGDFTLVTIDSIVHRGAERGLEILHIVTHTDFYKKDEPEAWCVELIRPTWMYGSEGQLFPLKFIGRLSDEWLNIYNDPNNALITDEHDPFPEGDWLWALPNNARYSSGIKGANNSRPWKHAEPEFWGAMREGVKEKPNS